MIDGREGFCSTAAEDIALDETRRCLSTYEVDRPVGQSYTGSDTRPPVRGSASLARRRSACQMPGDRLSKIR
jgi:hypothetical protein